MPRHVKKIGIYLCPMPNPQEVCVYASFDEKLKGKPKLSDRLKMEDEHKLPDGLKRSNELNM